MAPVTHLRFRTLPLAILVGIIGACSDSAEPPAPVATTITLNRTTVSFDALGATEQLGATVKDQNGATMSASVTWTSSNSGVATVSASGLVTSVANGTAQITAASGSLSASAGVTVAQTPAQLDKVSGDAQTGTVGTQLAGALVVQVGDRLGHAVPGIDVSFAVSTDGGSVTPAPAGGTSDASGQVTTLWTLGTVAGSHTVSATPTTGAGLAQFTATVIADVADTLAVSSGDGQTGQQDAPLANPLVVRVADQYGNPVQGHTVDFAVTSGGGSVTPTTATTGADGLASTAWTLGPDLGSQTAQASASQGGSALVGSPLVFGATALAASPSEVSVHEGDNQTGLVGYDVNLPPAVIVKDIAGNPFPGAEVTFAVASGGGSITGAVATTGTDGVARVGSWTLGTSAGANTLTATVTGAGITGNPVTFTATGATQQYDIEIVFVQGAPNAAQQEAFDSAEVKWERLIFGDEQDISGVTIDTLKCAGDTIPVDLVNRTIDDVLIYADLLPIDGQGGILGQAGPCVLRSLGRLPIIGVMKFDVDDLDFLETNGQLDDVILHEMGHVLGFGTLWEILGLLHDKSDPANGGTAGADTYFDGPLALRAFDDAGGGGYAGAKVPVENDNTTYGTGSLDAHWRESVLVTELMTPSLNTAVPNPLSAVSVASMGDLGYTVNYGAADDFALPGPSAVAGLGGRIHLPEDAVLGTIWLMDANGRVQAVLRP